MIKKIKKHRVTIYLTEKQWDILKALARDTETSQGFIIRLALDKYLQKQIGKIL
jgi:hypothetical protein